MENVVYDLKNVYYAYLGKFPALAGIDLAVVRGEKIAIIGANGTGKSTLLAMFDGLIFPDTGAISFFGRVMDERAFDDATFSRHFRTKVGFVFQNPDVQLFCPTVKEDIVFAPLQFGVEKHKILWRLDKLVEILKIGHLLVRAPHELSVGEKRKVTIASVMINEPEILILDEPTAGLDPETSRSIIDMVLNLAAEGKTVITSTHDLHVAAEISDTVHVFGKDKRIIKTGGAGKILTDEKFLIENNLMHTHRHRHGDKIHTHAHLHEDHHNEKYHWPGAVNLREGTDGAKR
ncbi:MAG: ABC transporter ATP-binding protein [Candidatus Omnitrophica bacterium]|nr:ABC transporter ATP-binding protein [Candidatus Omnitrophota bacterium]